MLIGIGIDYEDYILQETLISTRQCENISLVDDNEIEDTEQFNLTGQFLFPSGNLTFNPSVALVFIEDNDGSATEAPTTTGISFYEGTWIDQLTIIIMRNHTFITNEQGRIRFILWPRSKGHSKLAITFPNLHLLNFHVHDSD